MRHLLDTTLREAIKFNQPLSDFELRHMNWAYMTLQLILKMAVRQPSKIIIALENEFLVGLLCEVIQKSIWTAKLELGEKNVVSYVLFG